MTEKQYRSRILAIEAWGRKEIDLLSTVVAKALPRAGESGKIADAVACMQRREQNAEAIVEIEELVAYITECVEAEWYGVDQPEPPLIAFSVELARWRKTWENEQADV